MISFSLGYFFAVLKCCYFWGASDGEYAHLCPICLVLGPEGLSNSNSRAKRGSPRYPEGTLDFSLLVKQNTSESYKVNHK